MFKNEHLPDTVAVRQMAVRDAIFAELKRQHEEPRAVWAGVSAFYDDDIQQGYIEGEPDWDAVAAAVTTALDNLP